MLNCDRPRPTTMRLTNFLLVAAAAVLASCEAVSTVTDSTQTKLSTMTSPDAVQSIDVVHGGKRFLRTTKTEKYEVDNDDDDDADGKDEEERVKTAKLLKHLDRDGIAYTKFKKWSNRRSPFTPTDFYNNYVTANGEWRPIYYKYFNWYKTAGY
ncbi:hypothetical protein BBJ29_007811 [Phytophthora kernoviae]|uniref:RxLR effector protein n=1 Tax=Phytophthora kernoviae TaxID=325452 RepID=A0A3F2RDK9_9STRA|nr:hypothetical protein BBP00_00009140 [Phytophthora kernoviae]RLN62836.1 hypothetical protein BBJ29_007811 [Phytophthora kernoviae]